MKFYCMEHIVITTDLSVNSKAGMRFGIRLARARQARLTFLHVHQVLRASFWSDSQYDYYIKKSHDVVLEEMTTFIKAVYRGMNVMDDTYKIAVHHNLDTVAGILEYASQNEATFICSSTRGAGGLRRFIGTNTGKMIAQSRIPIISVPSTYRAKPIKRVLYASDMRDYATELKKVVAFAAPLKVEIDMLHLSFADELIPNKTVMEEDIKRKAAYPVNLIYKDRDIDLSLSEEISDAVDIFKPGMLIMFTREEGSFIEKLFLPGTTKAYAFHAKVPMLSFKKVFVHDNKVLKQKEARQK